MATRHKHTPEELAERERRIEALKMLIRTAGGFKPYAEAVGLHVGVIRAMFYGTTRVSDRALGLTGAEAGNSETPAKRTARGVGSTQGVGDGYDGGLKKEGAYKSTSCVTESSMLLGEEARSDEGFEFMPAEGVKKGG
ncbi:MAG TPA: hypothetical protein PLL10_00040 [Elusimicrobiales bacterium]|nr:hypothetical protein [Elusimicrobiales bacterium]